MFRKSQKQFERQMLDIVNSRPNGNRCGECAAEYPTWASWNLGILLCGRCANCHRKVLGVTGPRGGPISKVKSLALESWSEDQLAQLSRIGNKKANSRWNPKKIPFPHDDDDDRPIEEFLRNKYISGRFRDDPIDADDYGDRNSRYSDDSGHSTPAGRTHSSSNVTRSQRGSRSLPRLSHRKCTSYELSKYRGAANKIMSYGFSDRDAVIESLVLSNGDTELALDILDLDSKVNPSSSELPPALPNRPQPSVQPAGATASNIPSTSNTPATSAGSEWWTGQAPQATGAPSLISGQATGFPSGQPAHSAHSAQSAQPQIYQYTDPVTGQVSYIDANGQQYLDPNNPQHQQLLMQQTNPQYLAQQATKSNILSLYSQPDRYTTNVAVPSTQQTGQQLQHSMQAQQQLTQQFTQQPQYTGAAFGGQVYGQVAPQFAPQQPMQTGVQPQYAQPQQFWR